MSGPPPLIRSACDRCHAKKVRCITSRQRNVCDRCIEHNVVCIFSPPGRNGRPPRNPPSEENQVPTNVTTSSTQPPHQAQSQVQQKQSPQQQTQPHAGPSKDHQNPQAENPNAMDTSSILSSDPFAGALDPTWSFVDDNDPFGPISPVGAPMLGVTHDHTAPPANNNKNNTHSDNDVMRGFWQTGRIPTPTPASFDLGQIRPPPADIQLEMAAHTEPPSPSETLRLLHIIQQKLHEECLRSSTTFIMPGSSTHVQRKLDMGVFLALIDEVHGIVRNVQLGPRMPCDFSTAMALATTMGSLVEVYELLFRCGVMSSPTAGTIAPSRVHHRAPSSSRLSLSSGSLVHGNGTVQPVSSIEGPYSSSNTSTSAPSPASTDSSSSFNIRIGSYIASEAVARHIIADVLLYQIECTHQLIDELRQHLVTAESSMMGASNRSMSHSALSFFSPQLQLTVVQLLNQLQTRIGKLEGMAMDEQRTRRHTMH